MSKYLIDIDNTITETQGDDYLNAQPIQERIDKINKLYDEGHIIWYWTARGAESGKDFFPLTFTQLKEWECKYHHLTFKPSANFIIDDKNILLKDFFK
jgi:hypothetical protein